MLSEPGQTQADLHFNLLGFPVRVHPFFWVLSLLLIRPCDKGVTPQMVLIWIPVVFVSILIHELGHSLAHRYYGHGSRIVLYAFGGLAIREYGGYTDSYGSSAYSHPESVGWKQIVISLAGPFAQFILAGLVIGSLYAVGVSMPFPFLGFDFTFGHGALPVNKHLAYLLFFLLQVNIYWGVLNLLPVYPLDGGQVARELFLIYGNRGQAIRNSLVLSIATAVAIALLAAVSALKDQDATGSLLPTFLFGYLAYQSYVTLQAYTGGGGFGGGGYGGGGRGW